MPASLDGPWHYGGNSGHEAGRGRHDPLNLPAEYYPLRDAGLPGAIIHA